MKSVEVIQKVKILPRAMASHQPGSNTRWREETNVRSRVEHVSRVCMAPRKLCESRGPERENHSRMPDPYGWETRTVSSRWNAVSALSLLAREGRGHRGPRPDHADTGIARELVRASSASCLDIRGSVQGRVPCGESTARPKLPVERPAPRRVDLSIKTRGRQVRRDKREREGTPDGREAVLADHRSDGTPVLSLKRKRAAPWASPARGDVRAGNTGAGTPGNPLRPWDLVERRASGVVRP